MKLISGLGHAYENRRFVRMYAYRRATWECTNPPYPNSRLRPCPSTCLRVFHCHLNHARACQYVINGVTVCAVYYCIFWGISLRMLATARLTVTKKDSVTVHAVPKVSLQLP